MSFHANGATPTWARAALCASTKSWWLLWANEVSAMAKRKVRDIIASEGLIKEAITSQFEGFESVCDDDDEH